MPSSAPVEEMKNDTIFEEQKIALDLLVKLIRKVHVARAVGAHFGPFAAD